MTLEDKKELYQKPWFFFALALGISFAFWIPFNILNCYILMDFYLSFSLDDIISYWYMYALAGLGGLGPVIATYFLTRKNYGKEGVTQLMAKGCQYENIGIWYIPILFIFGGIILGAYLLSILLTGQILGIWIRINIVQLILFFNFFYFLTYFEEFAWRGYALEELQKERSALSSSLILGFFWGVWHIPMQRCFYIFHFGIGTLISFLFFFFYLFSYSILLTWIYNNTDGSVFSVSIFHAIINLTINSIIIYPQTGADYDVFRLLIYLEIITFVIALIIIIHYYGFKTLSNKEIKPIPQDISRKRIFTKYLRIFLILMIVSVAAVLLYLVIFQSIPMFYIPL